MIKNNFLTLRMACVLLAVASPAAYATERIISSQQPMVVTEQVPPSANASLLELAQRIQEDLDDALFSDTIDSGSGPTISIPLDIFLDLAAEAIDEPSGADDRDVSDDDDESIEA